MAFTELAGCGPEVVNRKEEAAADPNIDPALFGMPDLPVDTAIETSSEAIDAHLPFSAGRG